MAKLSDFREPQDANAREEWRRKRPPFTLFPQLSDAVAETMLREILALRRQALRETGPAVGAAFDTAQQKARELVEGIAGWAFYGTIFERSAAADDFYSLLSPRERRDTIQSTLSRIPLLAGPQCEEIVHALGSLESGQVEEILRSPPKRQRRKRPRDAAEAELDILTIIRWEFGRGRPEYEVRGVIALALGLSPDAIEKWRKKAEKYFGKEVVRSRLNDAEAIGRMARQGAQADEPDIDWRLRKELHAMSLPSIIERWKGSR
jgi:hypothetical protein